MPFKPTYLIYENSTALENTLIYDVKMPRVLC